MPMCLRPPRTLGRGKRQAESTPEGAVRPAKRASRVVQYVLSSNKEGDGDPICSEDPHTDRAGLGHPPVPHQAVDLTPQSEGVSDTKTAFHSSAHFASSGVDVQGSALNKSGPSIPSASVVT